MHIYCVLSTLFLQPLFALLTTVLLPSDLRKNASISILDGTNTTSNVLANSDSLPLSTSLTFHLFGSQIPSSAVNAAFGGAITKVYPFLHKQPDDPITGGEFRYRAIGGNVQIDVTAAVRHGISWQQLNSILRQVSSFMNGDVDRRPHMQELLFEVLKDGTKTGEGLISYHPSHGIQSRDPTPAPKNTNDTKLLLALTDPSIDTQTGNAFHFPIPNTPFILIIGFLGDAIPISGVWAAFEGAHTQIIGPLGQHPSSPIPGERFEYGEQGVRITVLVKRGTIMTWKQLSWVLGGMYGFITGAPGHYQLLTCEISFTGHGMVGFASVWYYPPSLQVTKRTLNTTAHLLLIPNTSPWISFAVPDTPLVLNFTYIGSSIPQHDLDDTILTALNQIRPSWQRYGPYPVPGNQFFRALNGVRISIFANVPHVMSWIELHGIVLGLYLFVNGREYHRRLNFDVEDVRAGKLAYGTVRYKAPRVVGSGGVD